MPIAPRSLALPETPRPMSLRMMGVLRTGVKEVIVYGNVKYDKIIDDNGDDT